MKNPKPFAWGILGPGRIAGNFASALAAAGGHRLAAVGSRDPARAVAFAKTHGADAACGGYEEVLANPAVEAVYIATPHTAHCEWTVRAAEAGKHVLCEKPAGVNHAEAMIMAGAARANGVLFAEAFMVRFHPQTRKLIELIRSGMAGGIRWLRGTFAFQTNFSPASRLWSHELAGGGILDVGCYPVSMARLVAGAAMGKSFAEPVAIVGCGVLHPETGVDCRASATLKFPCGMVAQLACGIDVALENSLVVVGEKGALRVPVPWIPNREGGVSIIEWTPAGGGGTEVIGVPADGWLYAYEADAVRDAVRSGRRELDEIPVADTLGNMAALDRWREAVGLQYEWEKPEQAVERPVRRRLAKNSPASIPAARIPGIDKALSRFVMGCDNQRSMPHAAAMWDDFFERGGNVFDTAWLYGHGAQEKLLGWWLRHRGIRDEVAVIVKGAHTPLCAPEHIATQLGESLGRLQTDFADIYFLHRDNPAIPVGEFVDALDAEVDAGRIGIFGGSNWGLGRIDEANAHAAKHGRRPFRALSNNFSLAEMVDPVWAGAISCGDPGSIEWLTRTGMPLFAWSSQARGFFLPEQSRNPDQQAEIDRCWGSEQNLERKRRAEKLAAEKGVSAVNIAAAYVLCQPFPTFALVGPRSIGETANSCAAFGISLGPEEIDRLRGVRQ